MSNHLAYNRERLAKLSQSVILDSLKDSMMATCKRLTSYNCGLKLRSARCLWTGGNQLQGLRHRLEAMSPMHRIGATKTACSKIRES